ncbi:3,4-dihydroxy-2-butanone-4-phosphate synthase [Mycobacterium arosiense]|uniref:3,4-dihydroxy-2-butanone-4-phosphate synthase n=1 Tax=Mycobacterium arosiense TaxID=425468 RepID=UPI0009F4BE50|nr:3,4-dihydroxy-2-butanone-4-phosphate synthase [Mycobacterium arosiense]
MFRQPRHIRGVNATDVDPSLVGPGAGAGKQHGVRITPETQALNDTGQSKFSCREHGREPVGDPGLPLGAEGVASESFSLNEVLSAIAAIAAGDPVVVVDGDHNCGDLVFAAESATTQLMAFTVRYTSGLVCVALPGEHCDRLGLPPISPCTGDDPAYRVTVDLRENGTGISAAARARTAVALSDPESSPLDFARPGHVLPIGARPGGVLERAGHAEAALDLVRLAGRRLAAVLCTIMSERISGETADCAELLGFAEQHGLQVISIKALKDYRRRTDPQVQCVGTQTATTADGDLHVLAFRSLYGDGSHLAFMAGAIRPGIPVYVHTECLNGDVVGLTTCACRSDLRKHLAAFVRSGEGVVVYIRRDGQPWTCDHFKQLSRCERGINDEVAAEILSELSVTSLRLLNDDHDLGQVLRSFGMYVNESC